MTTEQQTVWIVMYADGWNDKWCDGVFSSEEAAEAHISDMITRHPRTSRQSYYINDMPLKH